MTPATFVLLHGAYHGAWCWRGVAERLRALGHGVHTPTLTGLGERSHLLGCDPSLETFIEDVAQVIRYEDLREVVLVGHSFAGSVVSALADSMPERLRLLVYLDALLLRPGESSAMRSPERVEGYRRRAMETSNGATIPTAEPAHYGVVDPDAAAWLRARLTPHPTRTYFDPLEIDGEPGNGLPAAYVICTDPLFPALHASYAIAGSRPDWEIIELATGHDAMVTAPEALTEILARLVRPRPAGRGQIETTA